MAADGSAYVRMGDDGSSPGASPAAPVRALTRSSAAAAGAAPVPASYATAPGGSDVSPRAVAVVGSLNTLSRERVPSKSVAISVRADADITAADDGRDDLTTHGVGVGTGGGGGKRSNPSAGTGTGSKDPFLSHKSTASRKSQRSAKGEGAAAAAAAAAKAKGRSRCTWCGCVTLLLVLMAVCSILFAACMLRAAAQHNLQNIMALLETNGFNHSASDGTYTVVVDPADSAKYDLHDVEKVLLGTIYVRLCARDITLMRQILSGANVVVQRDKAFYYKLFSTLSEAYRRISSHHSIVPQYGVPEGHILKTLLTGERADTFSEVHGAGDTWFQFEGAEWNPFHNPSDSFVHLLNYMQYKLTNRNVGPLGTSPHTDKNPIIIPFANGPTPGPTPTPPVPAPTPPVGISADADADADAEGNAAAIAPHSAAAVRVPRAHPFAGAHNKSLHKARPSGSLQP